MYLTKNIICFSGPTGAGKSTAIKMAAPLFPDKIMLALEPTPRIPNSPYDTGSFFRFELAMIEARARLTLAARGGPIFAERSLWEDRAIFFPLHSKLKHINGEQHALLDARCDELIGLTPPISKVIYLTSPIEVIRKRMARRADAQWLVSSVEQQFDLYEVWYQELQVPRLTIDTSATPPIEVAHKVFNFVCEGG